MGWIVAVGNCNCKQSTVGEVETFSFLIYAIQIAEADDFQISSCP